MSYPIRKLRNGLTSLENETGARLGEFVERIALRAIESLPGESSDDIADVICETLAGYIRYRRDMVAWIEAHRNAPTYTGPTPPAPPFADASEESAKGVTCDLCGFSDATCVKVTDDEAEDEELAKLEYVRYTCRNCGHRWHEAV